MKSASRRYWLALVGLLLMCASAFAQAPAVLTPCRIDGVASEVLCGVVARALNPSDPGSARIDLHFVVLPALARRKLPDPVFWLPGGPGQSAIALAAQARQQLLRLNNRRDLVLVDQRGTGRSAPLMCQDTREVPAQQQMQGDWQLQRQRQCLAELQRLPHGDLRFYTTELASQDLEAVRLALQAPQINLVGSSYGTRAALDYQRQFGQSVRRMLLDGVVPPDMSLPESAGSDSQAALQALFDGCAQDAECRRRFPDLAQQWQVLLNSLPRSISVRRPAQAQPETLWLTRQALLQAVRGPLYAPVLASGLPWALQQASAGRFEALLGLADLLQARGAQRLAEGMHLSVICAEDMALPALAKPSQPPAPGQELEQAYRQICQHWPRGSVSAAFYRLPVSASATLLLSGGLDPVTPPRHAERVAQALGGKARVVRVPNAGHNVLALGCMDELLFHFIDAATDAQALALDTQCAHGLPRPGSFVPTGLRPDARP